MGVNFKKLAIASAVGATLGLAGVAQADNTILFPYFKVSNTSFSFFSLYQDPYASRAAGFANATPSHDAVKVQLFYGLKKMGTPQTTGCIHRDYVVNMSEGYLAQWEAAGRFYAPESFGDTEAPELINLPATGRAIPLGHEGFLMVEYSSPAPKTGVLYGEAVVVDTATGMAIAYAADSVDGTGATPANFRTIAASHYVSSWYPNVHVSTSWYVLPMGTRAQMTPNLTGGGIETKVAPNTNNYNAGAYDRNEVYYSGGNTKVVKCFGMFEVANLLDFDRGMGGWFSLVTTTDGALPATGNTWDATVGYTDPTTAAASAAAPGTIVPTKVWKTQYTGELGVPAFMMSDVKYRIGR